MIRIAVLTTIGLSAFAQKIPDAKPADSYTVIYTGRMLGNFRFPELQCKEPTGCPAWSDTGATAILQSRIDDATGGAVGNVVRVASGDNFAPYLLARDQWDPHPGKGEGPPRLRLKLNAPEPGDPGYQEYVTGHRTIPSDNVVSALVKLQLDALVPGKHDFYFGPEILRELASRLREDSREASRMLAANLVLNTRRTDVRQPGDIAAEPLPLRPSGNAQRGLSSPVVALPKIVLPWMRSVRIRNAFDMKRASRNLSRVCIVPVGKDGNPPRENPACPADFAMQPAQDPDPHPDVEYELPKGGPLLQPEGRYAVCFTVLDTAATWSCTPFMVRNTFFEYPEDVDGLRKSKPWMLKPGAPGQLPVAIFGAVDPDLMQSVGRLNYTWVGVKMTGGKWEHDDDYETVVQAAQPGESLKQVLGYCLQDEACRSAHKVLLAQMPEEDAYGIVGQLQALKGLPPGAAFEVIVAAADKDRASGDRIIIRKRASGSQSEFRQPLVLVPGDHVPNTRVVSGLEVKNTDPYFLQPRVQRVIVTPGVDLQDRDFPGDRIFRNTVFNTATPPRKDAVEVTPVIQDAGSPGVLDRLRGSKLVKDTPLANKDATDDQVTHSIELIALRVMREACHADAAVLQHRDVLPGSNLLTLHVDDSWARAVIEAIFWKGDFIECVSLTGDSLNQILSRSRELQNDEDNGIVTDLTTGWGLATIGLDEDQSDPAKRAIGGAYLDLKKLYSVAITDYLANGDTGYPMLQTAQPLPADNWSSVRLQLLAGAIQEELWPSNPRLPETISHKAPVFLDDAVHSIPPAKHEAGLTDWARSLFRDDAANGKTPMELAAQQRLVWSIDLYKADASLSLFLHKGTEPQLGQRFPGVTTVDLSSPNTETIAFDYSLRVEAAGSHGSFYVESDLNYGHKANRTPTNVYQRSETADYYYHEIGYARNLWPMHRNSSTLKLLLPGAIRTQLWPPITQITPGADTAGAKAVASQAPINYTFSVRPGLRWDHVFPKPDTITAALPPTPPKGQPGQPQVQTGQLWTSYIEAGYEVGQLFNGPSAFTFTGTPKAGGSAYVNQCLVYDVGCIMNTSADTPTFSNYTATVTGGRNHTQAGFYLDFRLDVPLPKLTAIEFVTENRGDFFAFGRPGDSPADARFFNDMKGYLNIPIPGVRKLFLAPTFEWVAFRNRRTDYAGLLLPANTYFSYSSFVSLNYSFDWHQGLEWRKILGFNNPTPPLSSLPTR